MARPWQVPQLLLAFLVALLAVTQQSRRRSFVTVYEVSAVEEPVLGCLQFVTNEYNKQSNDTYNFRIIRILRILKQVSVCPTPALLTHLYMLDRCLSQALPPTNPAGRIHYENDQSSRSQQGTPLPMFDKMLFDAYKCASSWG